MRLLFKYERCSLGADPVELLLFGDEVDLGLGLHRVAHLAVQELVLLVGRHRRVAGKLKGVLLDRSHEAEALVLVTCGHGWARLAKHSGMVLHVGRVLIGRLAALVHRVVLSLHVGLQQAISLRVVTWLLLAVAVA